MLDFYVELKNTAQSLMTVVRFASVDSINMSTQGYKSREVFTLPIYPNDSYSGTESKGPIQTGSSGIMVSGVAIDMSPGEAIPAEPLNARIAGDSADRGFFIKKHPTFTGAYLFSKAGPSYINQNRVLVDSLGRPFMGYKVGLDGLPTSNRLEEINIDFDEYGTDIGVTDQGIIVANYSTPTERKPIAVLGLAAFDNPGFLKPFSDSFEQTLTSGEPQFGRAGGDGLFSNIDVKGGEVETSNVAIYEVILKITLASRQFSALTSATEIYSNMFKTLLSKWPT